MTGAAPRGRGLRPPRPGAASGRLRRARSIAVSWQRGRLTFENYLTRRTISAEPLAIAILSFFEDWRAPAELAAQLPDYRPASIARAISVLLEETLLVRQGSAAAARDETLAREWRDWLPQAGFHFATKDVPFASQRRWRELVGKFLAESPQPAIFKTYPDRKQHPLPAPAERAVGAAVGSDHEFVRVLLARQTHREFSGAAVPLAKIAELLHYTWGAMGELHTPSFGTLLHKTSPSGGARHPGEVYLVALDVDDLRPGIYHYNVRDHALEELRRGGPAGEPGRARLRAQLLDHAVGQRHVGNAAAVFLMTAVVPRSIWKYRSPRAYRVMTLDAGHLGQTFCLVATWLGLAPFTTAAMRDTAIEEALGIDGITETVLYIVGVGSPLAPPVEPTVEPPGEIAARPLATGSPRVAGGRRPNAPRRPARRSKR